MRSGFFISIKKGLNPLTWLHYQRFRNNQLISPRYCQRLSFWLTFSSISKPSTYSVEIYFAKPCVVFYAYSLTIDLPSVYLFILIHTNILCISASLLILLLIFCSCWCNDIYILLPVDIQFLSHSCSIDLNVGKYYQSTTPHE